MRVRIITSCTGEKKSHPDNQLVLADFQTGKFFKPELEAYEFSAGEMYDGQQHLRLMDGVQKFREAGHFVDLYVVSAGYGLIEESRIIQPYEATFIGMSTKEIREWGQQLVLPSSLMAKLGEPTDLQLVLLGDKYLQACGLNANLDLKAPTIFFCGAAASKKLPSVKNAIQVILANKDAKPFSCGLVGLKGEVTKRLLLKLSADPDLLERVENMSPADLLDSLAGSGSPGVIQKSRSPVAHPTVDQVISIPADWWQSPHKQRISYFIPEWDDLVDPDFDFLTDTHSGGSGDWSNEVYAHQMYPSPNYDGILVSRAVAEKSKKKAERINAMGVHRFLRVPRQFPIMGDCGAFDYIMEEVPPYSTEDVLDYYSRLDFDFGVSVDHLIVKATDSQRDFRYQLTIGNAEAFLTEHRKRGLDWTPIGAVQGWSPESYAEAARQYVAMGYDYIGLGGLVRSTTDELIRVITAVREKIPPETRIHLFGVARPKGIYRFAELGVTSVDSASYLRRAWMNRQNYLTSDGQFYAAIRIPEAEKSFRSKRMVLEGRASLEEVSRLELSCLRAVRAFDRGEATVQATLDSIMEYDCLITKERPDHEALIRRTLEDSPWRNCDCEICRTDGIEVAIFRGNNRNRRRGFHNTYVFYRMFSKAAIDGELPLAWAAEEPAAELQARLFEVGTP